MEKQIIRLKRIACVTGMLLLVMAITSSISSYNQTRKGLESDLHQALLLTIKDRGYERMRQDSIQAYRLLAMPSPETRVMTVNDPTFQRHLQTEALRPKAYIAYHITPRNEDFEVKMEAQASYSMAFVWGMSNQRLSFWLFVGTLLSLFFSLWKRETVRTENLVMPLHLTPMQEQLMALFLQAPDHKLTKQEICDALWPNKDNASETLYTTIRRLRNELQQASDWEILSERGKSYELKHRQPSDQ